MLVALSRGRIDWERIYRIMSLHSVSNIVYYVMREVFGEKCRLASLGLLENERDRSVYLFDEKLDKEKLCQVEEMYNKIMLNGYDVRI